MFFRTIFSVLQGLFKTIFSVLQGLLQDNLQCSSRPSSRQSSAFFSTIFKTIFSVLLHHLQPSSRPWPSFFITILNLFKAFFSSLKHSSKQSCIIFNLPKDNLWPSSKPSCIIYNWSSSILLKTIFFETLLNYFLKHIPVFFKTTCPAIFEISLQNNSKILAWCDHSICDVNRMRVRDRCRL